MATSSDIQEIISKLSSDKAKAREEGIKLLNSWLEGERSITFCKLLSRNTARLKPNEIPHVETWPFLITILMKCITLEISSSKKRLPKLSFAKTLRNVIQRAEDAKFYGKTLLLLSAVKQLFNHIWDVVRDAPNFQSEYGTILRHLLAVKEYRFHMRKRVYCSLVVWYMNKIEMSMEGTDNFQPNIREEVFRYILTLHSLLENPPGDFPDNLREDLIKGFVGIFSHVREEGKVSRKLVECINTFLLRDGPNLGSQSMKIHSSVQDFMIRFWLSTHDRGLKSSLIHYARIQLKLCRSATDGYPLIQQLLDVVGKELDQGNVAGTGIARSDTARDDKLGALANSHCRLMELAASVFYQACVNTAKEPLSEKRIRREHAADRLKDGLVKGNWLWIAAFCFLIRNYRFRISNALVNYWFQGICESFERILIDGNRMHAYDSLVWVLRSLQELSSLKPFLSSIEGSLQCPSITYNKVRGGWHLIWSCLMHALPMLSNVTPIADAALALLGNIISNDLVNVTSVPQDVWDLRLFKHMPSACALYFVACYFSRKGCQGDLREVLHLRQTLLRAVLGLFNLKESFFLNERMVMLLPAAIFSLCAGCVPLPYFSRELSVDSRIDVLDATESWTKIEDNDQELVHELLECSVEKIAEIESGSDAEVFRTQYSHGLRLPRRIRYPLVHEMEDYFRINISSDEKIQKLLLSDLFLLSALFSNCIYCSMLTRLREEKSTFLTRMLQHLLELLDRAVAVIEENYNDLQSHGSLGSGLIPDFTTALASLRFCICCPLFSMWRDKSTIHDELCMRVILVTKRLLLALTKLFEEFSKFTCNAESDLLVPEHSHSSLLRSSDISGDGKMRIVDMELDLDEEPKDIDISVVAGKNISAISSLVVQLKLDMISAISSFFSVLPDVTWEVMFDLLGKENDATVCENILHWLCEKYSCSSTRNMSDLVRSLKNRMEVNECSKPCCVDILAAIHSLLRTLLPFSSVGKEDVSRSVREKVPEQNIVPLGDLVNQIADSCTHDWSARIKLIDCICYFVSLDPHIAQGMIERLLVMLHDVDYRVRLFLARRIGVLFQTWDGHDELFQDICSNFGVKLVISSKGKLITAQEVLAVGAQSNLILETTIVTLSHLAFVSEKVELEAIFMICAVAAIDPLQRELVYTILDNLSRELNYTTRSKYLAELIASILFCWVACGLSLVSLVEVRHLFLCESEPNSFMQYCCPWLLPALILSGSTSELNWVSMVASQPLAGLVKVHFVPIFAVCMALHCSQKSNKENGAVVLRSSILQIGEIVEHERDDLIKKNMLSIVSCLLSLSSAASDPVMPFFPRETIVIAVKTVVDGFLEMDNNSANIGLVDKIHIFRPDRVFKFLVEIHYQITSAVHSRHRCNRLFAVEVLISTIRYRALVPSTSCYIFSLVGQYIGFKALQDQCCLILSMLLEEFKINPTKNVIEVLGEQLQFLVSKLVACCIPSENNQDPAVTQSSGIISLLHQLTVDADPSLHDYIRELEPFPELDCLEKILTFHQKLCEAYSPKDHFMKFVRRTCYLPQRLILWRLQTLHKKLLMREIIQLEGNTDDVLHEFNGWNCEPEIVSAVWNLVGLCIMNDAKDIRVLVADFISRVGIGDPHGVVFHLPGNSNQRSLFQFHSIGELGFGADIAVSEELLVKLITMLKKYLLDDSVKIVDSTSRALRGILSTERGQSALLSFESYDRSLIAIHSKGVNLDLVQKFLSASETKSSAEVISLEDPSLWKTHGKTFELWICTLVYSLIDHTSDTILRLCQDMVFLKAEVAELLFPVVLMNLAGRMDMNTEVCQLISVQVQENIFTESNDLMRSVQVMLDALNILRLCHVNERADTSSTSSKQEISKNVRTSSYSSRSRNSSASEKSKKLSMTPKTGVMSSSSWKKVYWLAIDYLLVAKAAIHCGSYFTSVMYVEHWCEEHFNCLTLGKPDFSDLEMLPPHIELLAAAVRQINEPDSIYGIIQSHKLTSQIVMFEHEGNWSKALESYDLLVRTPRMEQMDGLSDYFSRGHSQAIQQQSSVQSENGAWNWKSHKGLMRSLQQTGCTHVLDMYCHGLTTQKDLIQHDSEFTELQYEAAWQAGNWDFSLLSMDANSSCSGHFKCGHFNENLYCCLRALQEGDSDEFRMKLKDSKQELVLEISRASKESTESIYSAIIKLQILDHLGNSWDLRWKPLQERTKSCTEIQNIFPEPVIPSMTQLEWLNVDWSLILKRTQLHLNLIEPFIAFRRVLLQILNCNECTIHHLLHSASALRKGGRFSLAAAALHEFRLLCSGAERQAAASYICSLGRLEEAKLLRAQGQHEMAINLARYILDHYQLKEASSNVHRLVGKWLAETRSSNSRTILEQYLKRAVELNEANRSTEKKYIARQCQTYFHLAHYTDALFRNYEERLASSEWQAAMRLRKHKTNELDALIRRVKSSTKGEKTDCSVKIQELQKQLAMDREEAQKLQDDRDKFLNLALEGYQHCLVIGDKYDLRAVFRLVSLWFSLSSRQNVINSMLSAVKEVESYKFVPLMYQIASRMGSSKEGQGSMNFQFALVSLVKKMAVDHPYHTIFQLLALANGDRVKDKQRSRNSFVVDMDKKLAAENLLDELSSFHGARIRQMKQLVEIYIKLAELETKKEDTRRITLPREIRNLRELELVPVVTATFPVDRSCQYHEGSFPHFKGLADSITVMNGINAPKVIECIGSDGHRYRQLAKSGNDDLRQDAVMEQFFGLVNTFLQNHRDTWKRRLSIRTYKVVPFTPSAGVLEWVDRTTPLGDYLLGSTRSGGAHRRYGDGDWAFLLCRQHMTNEKDKRKAFLEVCENFRPVMHYFFLERYLHPADWFEKRLSYTRSVAASSMVGYIVGLGDRHSMNILLDEATAEVVHIDLGVAFEQGLMLKTPERVPFRLTRDIIDGMGVTGVEGVFRRCSEETLSVMRTNKEALLTIIEVFIHDPLYKWALSPLKALQRQKEIDDDIGASLEGSQDDYEGNRDAARALMRVKQKLDGYEDGEMRSVQGQVQQLIQDAIDTDRLCHMFPGWGAWL